MEWRLGIDLGTNSLGWWAFELHGRQGKRARKISRSLRGGVYIFPDGREPAKKGRVGDSNAVQRRLARSMRRNRDRHKCRLRAYMKELVKLKLMPSRGDERDRLFHSHANDPDAYNPYRLRAAAVERELTAYELGRALYHLGLRRGFKSNRIDQNDDDGGKLRDAVDKLDNELGNQTLGQFLWKRLQQENKRRQQGFSVSGIRFRGTDEFYPNRAMYEQEFDAIRKFQSRGHNLTSENWDRLRSYVLFQRPLKRVERGKCQFYPDEYRHWQDTPIGHDYRIYQEVNHLRWFDSDQREHSLDDTQRDTVIASLMKQKTEVKFSSLIKKTRSDGSLLFENCIRFNFESEGRKGLKPHSVGAIFSKNPVLAPLWQQRCSASGDEGMLDNIYESLLAESEQEEVENQLTRNYGLDQDTVTALLKLKIPSRKTSSVSRKFMEQIVPILRDQGLRYSAAVRELVDENGTPLHHSQRFTTGSEKKLPYYGKILRNSMLGGDSSKDPNLEPEKHYGKIGNPTVHVALNSLRKVVNALVEYFGVPPVEIHVELARELKQSRADRDWTSKQQAQRKKENDRIRSEYTSQSLSGLDMKKIKLWEELGANRFDRCCPFSGVPISFAQLMNGEAEIEHILPFRRTLDNSMSNLTVAMRQANRLKGNHTPYEAFAGNAHSQNGIEWETIKRISSRLPKNKQWRFGPDAMQRFEEENDFLARQETDNAYIARVAQEYLACLQGVEQIVPNRGYLTALLRGKWRLNTILSDRNAKNRDDHRHHAIDAAVVGLTNRSLLKKLSTETARGADDRVHIQVPELLDDMVQNIREQIGTMIVSFKPDHGWQGSMYKQSAYGFLEPQQIDSAFPDYQLVVRKPLIDLTLGECGRIRDRKIREQIGSLLSQNERRMKQILTRFSEEHGIRNVRILVKDQTAKEILSAPYKRYSPDSYVCCDIWRVPEGRPKSWRRGAYKWHGCFWSYMETPDGVPNPEKKKPHCAAKLVARLFKNDMVAYRDQGSTCIMRVAGFSTTNNKLIVARHTVATSSQKFVSINQLGQKSIRKLWVSPDGQVKGLKQ